MYICRAREKEGDYMCICICICIYLKKNIYTHMVRCPIFCIQFGKVAIRDSPHPSLHHPCHGKHVGPPCEAWGWMSPSYVYFHIGYGILDTHVYMYIYCIYIYSIMYNK